MTTVATAPAPVVVDQPPAGSVTCARCSSVTTDPEGRKWRVDTPAPVVQGVTLGLCVRCLTGQPVPAEGTRRCDGSCNGSHRPEKGTYYVARWGDRESWYCWDKACAEAWANDHDDDCDCCGNYVDITVYKVVDGKRVWDKR